jgi:hypothetical protein
VVLTPGQPLVLMYKNDPLYGVQYEKAITDTFSLTGSELDITAIPYYFSINSIYSNSIVYDWKINGVSLSDGLNNPTKAFRKIGDVSGTSNISLSVNRNDTMFQNANQNIIINFQSNNNQSSI